LTDNASQALLGSASGAGQYVIAPSVTLSGITAESQYFVEISGADTTLNTLGKKRPHHLRAC
jgi:hypothetical protein